MSERNIFDLLYEQHGMPKEELMAMAKKLIAEGKPAVFTFGDPKTEIGRKELEVMNARLQSLALVDQLERMMSTVKYRMLGAEPFDWQEWQERTGYADLMKEAEAATERYIVLHNELKMLRSNQ